MGMNQKTAYKILGIGPGASLAQAKKAFRDLAKKNHPDRYPSCSPDTCPGGEIGSAKAEARMDRMKQINQAFHFLAPLLPSADEVPDKSATDKAFTSKAATSKAFTDTPPRAPEKNASSKTNLWFLDILGRLKKGIKSKFFGKVDPLSTSCVKKPLKSKVKNREQKAVRFSTILNTLHPGAGFDEKSRDSGGTIQPRDSNTCPKGLRGQPYGNYIKYMALKKKIDARAGRYGEQTFDRIEKIRPVKGVNSLGDKE